LRTKEKSLLPSLIFLNPMFITYNKLNKQAQRSRLEMAPIALTKDK